MEVKEEEVKAETRAEADEADAAKVSLFTQLDDAV